MLALEEAAPCTLLEPRIRHIRSLILVASIGQPVAEYGRHSQRRRVLHVEKRSLVAMPTFLRRYPRSPLLTIIQQEAHVTLPSLSAFDKRNKWVNVRPTTATTSDHTIRDDWNGFLDKSKRRNQWIFCHSQSCLSLLLTSPSFKLR